MLTILEYRDSDFYEVQVKLSLSTITRDHANLDINILVKVIFQCKNAGFILSIVCLKRGFGD